MSHSGTNFKIAMKLEHNFLLIVPKKVKIAKTYKRTKVVEINKIKMQDYPPMVNSILTKRFCTVLKMKKVTLQKLTNFWQIRFKIKNQAPLKIIKIFIEKNIKSNYKSQKKKSASTKSCQGQKKSNKSTKMKAIFISRMIRITPLIQI